MSTTKIPHEGSLTVPIEPTNSKSWAHLEHCCPAHEFVYILRNADQDVLYIGITWSAKSRWNAHRSKKPWWPEVASAELICFESEYKALAHELSLIKSIRPLHNKRGAVN
jgi:predicted GIY-YIG superfamily endonuclease